jgi:hypothetical protein
LPALLFIFSFVLVVFFLLLVFFVLLFFQVAAVSITRNVRMKNSIKRGSRNDLLTVV